MVSVSVIGVATATMEIALPIITHCKQTRILYMFIDANAYMKDHIFELSSNTDSDGSSADTEILPLSCASF